VANFRYLLWYPSWSLLIVVLDITIIWAPAMYLSEPA